MDISLNDFKTKQQLDELVKDVKAFATVFRFLTIGVYIGYLLFRFITGQGFLAVNILLAVATLAFLGFTIYFTVNEKSAHDYKIGKAQIKKLYRWTKIAATAISAVLSIVGIFTAVETPSTVAVLLAVAMPVVLILQILFELLLYYVTFRVELFKQALSEDVSMLKANASKIVKDLVLSFVFHKKSAKTAIEELPNEPIVVGDNDDSVFLKRRAHDEVAASIAEVGENTDEPYIVGMDEWDAPPPAPTKKKKEQASEKKPNIFERAKDRLFKKKKEE